ncbi:flagellin-like hook-associated protein FlgL [Sulfuritortus calidifontis]|uniref:Flagellin-like hook-associated protein FlgL n=1 Tax=Sulfuritortus calidifontis TaxID=1914471 RepID=A0A4R3JSD1_9PROT|nr:flagellin [Sulfuritortus calidifontis]TCS70126.1 flagellin-like hook-associated protein FlgL [Sulfuritortus calidifontis]
MGVGDIALTTAMRSNLVSLQQTTELMGRTQQRLSTGNRVNTALDNPANYFIARANNQRADLLNGLKDNIGQAIQTIKQTDNTVKSITTLIENLRAQIATARTARTQVGSAALMRGIASGMANIYKQIDNLRLDSTYNGISLMSSGVAMKINFNENATTFLKFSGFAGTLSGLGLITSGNGLGTANGVISGRTAGQIATVIYTGGFDVAYVNSAGGISSQSVNFSSATMTGTAGDIRFERMESSLNIALAKLQKESTTLAANLSILTTRQVYITDTVNTLTEGATKLTVADTNEEGANMLLLQTRQSLGVTSLSLASQSAQSILRLFG